MLREMLKHWNAVPLLLACLCAGCTLGESKPADEPVPPEPGQTAPTPTATPSDANRGGAVAAMINGQALYMAQLNDLLLRAHGLEMAQQLIANELARQALVQAKLPPVTDEEVQTESDRTLRQVFGDAFEPDQRAKLLSQLLDREHISRERWDLVTRRNTMLRKIATPMVRVTDEDVNRAYGDRFGRRVVVRHIQTETAGQAQTILKMLEDGADFVALARKYSRSPSASDGGLLPEMTLSTPEQVPPLLRQTAWALSEPNQLSSIVQVGSTFHILRLDDVVQPQNPKMDEAREQLRGEMRERGIQAACEQILRQLIQKARIEYTQPTLREQARQEESP